MKKQGRADRDVRESTQPVPISKSVSPGGANQPGQIEYKGSRPMYDGGRGYASPQPHDTKTLNSGSQGKYK
jgi:hypothetical protein